MSSQIDNRAIKKALNKVSNSEKLNRSVKKRSEDYQVFQDVFNKPTLLTLYSPVSYTHLTLPRILLV